MDKLFIILLAINTVINCIGLYNILTFFKFDIDLGIKFNSPSWCRRICNILILVICIWLTPLINTDFNIKLIMILFFATVLMFYFVILFAFILALIDIDLYKSVYLKYKDLFDFNVKNAVKFYLIIFLKNLLLFIILFFV